MLKFFAFLYGLVFAKACDSDIDRAIDKVGEVVNENIPLSKEKLLIGQWKSDTTIHDTDEIDGEVVSYQMQFSCKTEYFPTDTFNSDCEMTISYTGLPMKMVFDAYFTGTWQIDGEYLYTVTEDMKMNLASVQIEQKIISDPIEVRQIQKDIWDGEKIEDLMPKKETTKYEVLVLDQTRLVTQSEAEGQMITENSIRQ